MEWPQVPRWSAIVATKHAPVALWSATVATEQKKGPPERNCGYRACPSGHFEHQVAPEQRLHVFLRVWALRTAKAG